MSYTLLVVRCFVQTGQNAPHEAFLVVVLDINYTLPFLQMFRGGDEGATVERAVFGYYKYELGHSLDYESGTSCIKNFHLGIQRGQNTIDVDSTEPLTSCGRVWKWPTTWWMSPSTSLVKTALLRTCTCTDLYTYTGIFSTTFGTVTIQQQQQLLLLLLLLLLLPLWCVVTSIHKVRTTYP